jgi:amino acid transporter
MTIAERSEGSNEPLARQLSAMGVWLLVINGMIGAGIFGLPSEAARLAGNFSPWVFLICAGLMLPVMLCFAELASHFDGTGGPVRYAGSVFGPYAGFMAGWAFYVARLTAFAANAVLLVTAIGYFWPAADQPSIRLALLFAICAGLTANTVVGTRNAMGSLGLLTLLKFVPLLGLVAFGIARLPAAVVGSLGSAWPADADPGAAILLVFYAFVGFESGLVPAGEARNPRRDMPRALFWAIGVVAVLYFAIQSVSLAVMPQDLAAAKRPLVEVSGRLFGTAGAIAMMLGVVASVGGNLAGSLFSTPRITYALALEGALPSWFAKVAVRFGTPATSIVVFGTIALLLAAGGSFVWLAGLSVLARVFIYVGCIAALPELRRRATRGEVMRLWGGLTIPALAVLVCLALLTQVKRQDYAVTALMLGVGSALYALARHSAKSRTA